MMSMGMGLSMGMGMYQRIEQRIEQRMISVQMPSIQWSLLGAYKAGKAGPPPYVPPTFEEEVFKPRIKLKLRKIADFDSLDHVAKMQAVDEANEVFRFAYTRGTDEDSGEEKYFFKIPLLRDRNITHGHDGTKKIRVRISRKEYERAMATIKAVGEMERIARAIPYYGLYKTVCSHLKKYSVGLNKVVLVSVDRGGRIPCIVLQHALGLVLMETLKVDQGGGRLDENKLQDFASRKVLRKKHILFVDSTVDSGRQIAVLKRYFDNDSWKKKLKHLSWSIVGSNEYAKNLDHHCNINWGVDPDTTFEDEPELMGIDYGSSHTEVVECPCEASRAIRKCLLAVPEGFVYDADNIDEQISSQRQEWEKRQKERRAEHKAKVAKGMAEHQQEVEVFRKEQAEQKVCDAVEREHSRILATKKWKNLTKQSSTVSFDSLPSVIPNGEPHLLRNILVVGNGGKVDVTQQVADLIADTLGPHHSFFAGTPDGNPGTVIKTVLGRVAKPEVRLYQPGYRHGKTDDSFGGVPVVFAGNGKEDMRAQMVKDSHLTLVLGGASGTLREVLLAVKFGKPVVLVKGWGAIPAYLLSRKKFANSPHVKACEGIAEAIQTILDLTKV